MKTDDRRRFARRRIARRLGRLRPLLTVLGVAAAIGGLVWLFFFSTVLAVENVDVKGTDVVSVAKVRELADVPLGDPLARIDTAAVQARVEDLAAVKSVEVSRCWPDTVCIDITERQSVAVVDKEGNLWGLDDSGILFRQYTERPAGLPLVRMKATTSTDALAESAEIIAALPESIAKRVDYLDVRTVDEISLQLRSGAIVIWGSADDSYNKVRVLGPLLEARPGATEYNVSVPGSPTARM
ncbi:MAG TPA: FtsQ-type POTRA domain-containing protein [Nocardioidaceae bacterium]|nr:FtsQ-type POTRA domain-containing protein [Nocardioidaceae bacterium]